jgi:hypothetical protein
MSGETRMDNETISENERADEGLQASGDAILISESIYAGLKEIADAIRLVAVNLSEEQTESQEEEFYIDGTRK